MILKEEVQHIARLARLGLTKKEVEQYQREFSSILGYVEKLKKAKVAKVKIADYFFKNKNITRKDESNKEQMVSEKLLKLFPEIKDGCLKIKSILQDEIN